MQEKDGSYLIFHWKHLYTGLVTALLVEVLKQVATNEGMTEGFKMGNCTIQQEVQAQYPRKADEPLLWE